MTSFASQIRRDRPENIYLVRGTSGGRPAWFYVLIEPLRKHAFLRAIESGSLDVADYGEILFSGWGVDPPAEIVGKVERREFD